MRSRLASILASVGCVAAVAIAFAPTTACTSKDVQQTSYFDRTISPILITSCTRTNTGVGCHVSDPKGNAFGNLDTSAFSFVNKRRDLLQVYGPYGSSAMLIKNVPPYSIEIQTFDGAKTSIKTDIRHTGGSILDPTGTAYLTLRRWIDNGATENNTGVPPVAVARNACTATVPPAEPGFNPGADPGTPDWDQFKNSVNPVLAKSCAASNCHGTPANELYLTCGQTPEQIRWNYFAATEYLAQTPEQSELVRRPLAPSGGGAYHEGGVVFQNQQDPDYQAIFNWAKAHGPLKTTGLSNEFLFFAHRVQPVLVRKGCMMIQCHSAAMFHDYRLRGGSGGAFSLSASKKNYELSLGQLAIESDDIATSRIVRKNMYRPELFTGGRGILHRGGPLFEDFGNDAARGDLCDGQNYDYDNGSLDTIPGLCVIREWHKRERAARNLTPFSGIVYVSRTIPAAPDRAQDFDVYAGGSDLHIASATINANGDPVVGADVSVTAGCGLSTGTADIKRPAVSWDGKKIAFAARSSASEPLAIYEMDANGANCVKHAEINAGPPTANGLTIHNFDPQYSPPDANGKVHLIFASTRGYSSTNFDYSGPQRTPADPTKPNANLYVFEEDPLSPGKNRIRQLTFQLNLERYPSFMSDGRAIMTTEKRAVNFYQLALRRINVDGGDYHPLYGQRGSIGFPEVTQVVELADKDFAAIFSDPGTPHQGGTLGIFNRSIGIDYHSAAPEDYPLDKTVTDPNSPTSVEPNFFLHSLKFPDAPPNGKPYTGVYTSPASLPSGKVLVSYGPGAPAGFGGDYDIYVMDLATGLKAKILGTAGRADIEAVGIYARVPRGVFRSTFDEPNGHTQVFSDKSEADITVLNVPIIASLLFQNTPTGRPLEAPPSFEIYEDLPPTQDVTSFGAGGAFVAKDAFGQVYVRRRLVGAVPVLSDGSARFSIPGGMPMVIKLPETDASRAGNWPRFQREAMSFYPGEYSHQSFQRGFFDGMCAACHGSVSGKPIDSAVQPDLLTAASAVIARDSAASNLNLPPAQRGAIIGPPPN